MRLKSLVGLLNLFVAGLIFLSFGASAAYAYGEYLVADRTLGRVLRYDEGGTFLGTLLYDPSLGVGLGSSDGGITALTLSPDQSRLYVSDRLSNRIAVYNYTGTTATHAFDIAYPNVFPSTLFVPAGTTFSQDGSKLFIANLGPFSTVGLPQGDTVAQVNPNTGLSGGADLTGGPAVGRAGLAFTPGGDLLVTASNFGGSGSVLRYDSGSNQFVSFTATYPELRGAANLLVVGNGLYVTAGFGGRVAKFDATTGDLDSTFGVGGFVGGTPDFAFPASIALGPDGNSLLVGVLGGSTGDSHIQKLSLSGADLGLWADHTHDTNYPPNGTGTVPSSNILGFTEPTAMTHTTAIPEPSTGLAFTFAGAMLGAIRRRRRG